MRMRIDNLLDEQLSIDIPEADGGQVRELIPIGGSVTVRDVDPYDVNIDALTRLQNDRGDIRITFLADPDDLVGLPGSTAIVGFAGWFNQIAFGSGLAVTDNGDGTATIDATGGGGGGAAVLTFAAEQVLASTTTRYLFAGGAGNDQAPTVPRALVSPRSGTLSKLRVIHNEPNGNGNSLTYTVRVAGSSTLLAATMASTDIVGFNTLNTALVVAGQQVDVQVTKSSSIGASPRGVVVAVELS